MVNEVDAYGILCVHTRHKDVCSKLDARQRILELSQLVSSTAFRNGLGISSTSTSGTSIAPKVEELLRGWRNQQLDAAAAVRTVIVGVQNSSRNHHRLKQSSQGNRESWWILDIAHAKVNSLRHIFWLFLTCANLSSVTPLGSRSRNTHIRFIWHVCHVMSYDVFVFP